MHNAYAKILMDLLILLFLELRQVSFDDCDFYGGDIPGSYKEHSTKKECRELCYNNYRCSHYTWAPLNGLNKCHLKDIGRWVDARRLSGAECGYLPGRIQW